MVTSRNPELLPTSVLYRSTLSEFIDSISQGNDDDSIEVDASLNAMSQIDDF